MTALAAAIMALLTLGAACAIAILGGWTGMVAPARTPVPDTDEMRRRLTEEAALLADEEESP